MSRRKTRERNQQVYSQLVEMRQAAAPDVDDDDEIDSPQHGSNKMKKFRFQLLHEWLISETKPCRIADIGGGKGLLTHLLRNSGWDAVVIDPEYQELPRKYKDFHTQKRIRIPVDLKIPRISRKFEPFMAGQFDLLIGLHAHGCNINLTSEKNAGHRG
jgi:hypothetical protein